EHALDEVEFGRRCVQLHRGVPLGDRQALQLCRYLHRVCFVRCDRELDRRTTYSHIAVEVLRLQMGEPVRQRKHAGHRSARANAIGKWWKGRAFPSMTVRTRDPDFVAVAARNSTA